MNKAPYRPFYFPRGIVKVDRDLARELHRLGLRIMADDVRPYPFLVRSMAPSGPMMETLMGIRRAGADIIITYHAKEAAKLLG